MHRLTELSPQQRTRAGAALLALGAVLLTVGVIVVHYGGLPKVEFIDGREVPLEVEYFNWIPRGWLPKAVGYLISFAASQALLAGATLLWVLGRPMTWARATFAAFLAWIELVMIFGIVPSEWLNLAQTDLDWGSQRVAFTIPPPLVLGNDVSISFAAIKDAISGTYNLVMLVAAAVFAYRIQDLNEPRKAAPAPEPVRSPYGRPLVRGSD